MTPSLFMFFCSHGYFTNPIACLGFPLSPVREGHLAIIYLTSAEVKMLNETLTTRDAYLELRGLKPEDLN